MTHSSYMKTPKLTTNMSISFSFTDMGEISNIQMESLINFQEHPQLNFITPEDIFNVQQLT